MTSFDYSSPNAYFITVCTVNRRNLFWNDTNTPIGNLKDIPLTPAGVIVQKRISDISKRYPMISVDCFAVMPNHIHLLLRITAVPDGRPMTAPTISRVVNQLKGTISKEIGFSVWQKGFHDHIVRGDHDYAAIWTYIERNPYEWKEDELYG